MCVLVYRHPLLDFFTMEVLVTSKQQAQQQQPGQAQEGEQATGKAAHAMSHACSM